MSNTSSDMPTIPVAQRQAIVRYWKNKPHTEQYAPPTDSVADVEKYGFNLVIDVPATSGVGYCPFWPGDHERAVAHYEKLWSNGQLSLF